MAYCLKRMKKITCCFVLDRDLKPENILLNDEMHIQITDFGSAKILQTDSRRSTFYYMYEACTKVYGV